MDYMRQTGFIKTLLYENHTITIIEVLEWV